MSEEEKICIIDELEYRIADRRFIFGGTDLYAMIAEHLAMCLPNAAMQDVHKGQIPFGRYRIIIEQYGE